MMPRRTVIVQHSPLWAAHEQYLVDALRFIVADHEQSGICCSAPVTLPLLNSFCALHSEKAGKQQARHLSCLETERNVRSNNLRLTAERQKAIEDQNLNSTSMYSLHSLIGKLLSITDAFYHDFGLCECKNCRVLDSLKSNKTFTLVGLIHNTGVTDNEKVALLSYLSGTKELEKKHRIQEIHPFQITSQANDGPVTILDIHSYADQCRLQSCLSAGY